MGVATILEVLIIAGIIVAQFRIFNQSRNKIQKLENVYPLPEGLAIQEYYLTNEIKEESESDEEIRYYNNLAEAIDAGEPFIYPNNELHVHQVKETYGESIFVKVTAFNEDDDDEYIVSEYSIKDDTLFNLFANGTVVFVHEISYSPNPAISEFENPTVDLIEAKNTSPEFQDIVNDTNEYLENNKGAAADFNILKDISERYSEALDNEVQAGIATPLYIGLLGTFLGVSFGLGSLLLGGDSDAADTVVENSSFITDAGIRNFLFGVAIAMAGSFCGLLLTLWGNSSLKTARSKRDKLKNGYYTFLQKRLLPKLNSDMAASLGNLKSVLDSFNHEFLEKVANFQPIIASLTDNIKIQKDFIVKLDEISFTKMANASIKVFEKVKESENLFEKFLGYQVALNKTLENGGEMADKVKGVLSRMTSLEEGINLVPGYLQKHDEAIMRQVQFFDQHKKAIDNIASKAEQNFDKDADHLKELMENRMKILNNDAQNASERWREHFNKLNEENIYQKILEFMQPFSKLNEQQDALNAQQNNMAKGVQVNNERLLHKLENDAVSQQILAESIHKFTEQIKILNQRLAPNKVQVLLNKVFGGNGNERGKV